MTALDFLTIALAGLFALCIAVAVAEIRARRKENDK